MDMRQAGLSRWLARALLVPGLGAQQSPSYSRFCRIRNQGRRGTVHGRPVESIATEICEID
jgi:hypothetical protein